uniref:Uncharacterized protein n=1 Tax=Arundo donax TaxID=35708 RepID=A0A0A9FWJ7_ARUDO
MVPKVNIRSFHEHSGHMFFFLCQ